MPVDPQVQTMLDAVAAVGGPPIQDMTPPQARELFKLMRVDGAVEPVAEVTDLAVPGPAGDIAVRVYSPSGADDAQGRLPMLVWFHGGGFVIGDLDTADNTCRKLASRAGTLVVSVDYRLAPEHPWPAAPEDCWAVLGWVAANAADFGGDPARLAVGGDSAGGNLAAVMALRARDEGGPALVHQLLVYPATDCTMSHPSVIENGEGYFLTADTMAWFTECYLGARDASGRPRGTDAEPVDPREPGVSPLFAADVSGVAPAQVITAEFDPLRDEGEAYAARLEESGVPVDLVRYDAMIHGFMGLATVTPVADQAVTAAADRLAAAYRVLA